MPFPDLDPEYPTIAVTSCYQQEKLQEFSIRSPGFCALTLDSPLVFGAFPEYHTSVLPWCLRAFPLLLQAAAASHSWEERFSFQDSPKSLPETVSSYQIVFLQHSCLRTAEIAIS